LSKKALHHGFVFFSLVLLFMYALEIDADARIGRGGSFGSRGTRSYSAPRTPSAPSSPSQQYNSPAPTPSSPASGGLLRGMGGGIMGGLMGGMLGGMLFRGLGFGGAGGMEGGGIGLFEIILVGLILYGIWWFIKKKRREESALGPSLYSNATSFPESGSASYAPSYAAPAEGRDVETGLGHILRMDPAFKEQPFKDQCLDTFFKVQGGWANRDMSTVKNLLTDEIYGITQADAEELKKNQHLNRLDNIAVRSVEITEAWQEAGKDYITVRFYANLLDYTVDEKTGQVISGSKTEPVKFEEYWTFTRPVGNGPWQLSAISQGQ